MLGGALGLADQIQFNYTTPPTLTSTSIGYNVSNSVTSGITTSYQTYGSITLGAGVYILTGRIQFFSITNNTSLIYEITNSTTSTTLVRSAASVKAGDEYSFMLTWTQSLPSSTQTIIFRAKLNAGTAQNSTTIDYTGIQATRIA